jgi:hypothetical protein
VTAAAGRTLLATAVLSIVALVPAGLPGTVRAQEKANSMERIDITNGRIVVGVLPSLGARVVELKAAGGPNLLDSDPKFWAPPYPSPSLDTPFAPWNGRIVWVGPQSGFWAQQDVRPGMKRVGVGWPPDPFNEAGRFEVLEKTPSRLRLKGAVSPVTGLSLEHDYEITGERMVRMKVTVTNGRETPVSWDLWPNTRVRPEGFPYVPLDRAHPARLDAPKPPQTAAGACPHAELRGWFTLPPGCEPAPGQQRLWTKAFLHPAQGLIAYFHGKQLLLIRAALVPKEKLHPEQAFIELYRGAGRQATILELEMHGPFETIAPGASASFEQTFEILDHDGPATPEAHVARLEKLAR